MPKGYMIVISHPNAAGTFTMPPPEYFEADQRVVAKHGGRRLVLSREIEQREGNSDVAGLMVIEFPDKSAAAAAYEEYMRDVYPMIPHLNKREIFIVEGLD